MVLLKEDHQGQHCSGQDSDKTKDKYKSWDHAAPSDARPTGYHGNCKHHYSYPGYHHGGISDGPSVLYVHCIDDASDLLQYAHLYVMILKNMYGGFE
jgi:hypothetical protein